MRTHAAPPCSRFLAALVSALALGLASAARSADEGGDRPELLLQTGHTKSVYSVAFTPDGTRLVSADAGVAVKLWKVETGELLRHWQPTGISPRCAALTPDGRYVAMGGSGGARVYDLQTGQPLRYGPEAAEAGDESTLRAGCVHSLAFSPDGTLLACGDHERTGDDPAAGRWVELWDWRTGTRVRRLEAQVSLAQSVAFSPDGKLLASGGKDGNVRLWDVATGTLVRSWQAHAKGVWSVAFDPKGGRLASGGEDDTPKLWEVETGALLVALGEGQSAEFEDHRQLTDKPPPRHTGAVRAVAWTPDGRRLASLGADGFIRLWDPDTGVMASGCRGSWCLAFSLAISPDGKRAATGDDVCAVRVIDLETGQWPLERRPDASKVYSVAVSPRGDLAASGAMGGGIALRDLRTGQSVRSFGEGGWVANGLAFTADGRHAISTDAYWGAYLWDVEAGTKLRTLVDPGPKLADFYPVAFSADGSRWAWRAADGRLEVREAESGALVGRPEGLETQNTLALSPDGKRLATATETSDRPVRVSEVDSGRLISSPEVRKGQVVTALAFSPDGQGLVGGDSGGQVVVWDPATGKALQEVRTGRAARVSALAVAPDGDSLVVGDEGGFVGFCDFSASEPSVRMEGAHGLITWSVAFTPDGRRAVSGGEDGTVVVWDAGRGKVLARLIAVDSRRVGEGWLAVTPGGYYDGTTNAARLVTWRLGDAVYSVEAYRDVFQRPDLVAKALRGEPLPDVRLLRADDVPPLARIVAPEPNADAPGTEVALHVVATGARELKDIEIYANGRRAPLDTERGIAMEARGIQMEARGIAMEARDVPAAHTTAKEFAGTVPLPPGEERVTLRIVVTDAGGLRSRPVEVVVFQRGVKPVQGTLHVLAVGVSDYANGAYKLAYAADDARAVAEAVRGQAGPDRLYAGVRSVALLNGAATSEAVKRELAALADTATAADTVMLFVAGHGVRDADYRYYLATYEADLGRLPETAVAWEEFQRLVRSLRAKQVLVCLDTCHAASGLGEYGTSNQALGEVLADRAGVMVLASSSAAEPSYESADWGHGAFTKAFLEALQGGAGKRLSPGVLEDYVGARVAQLTNDRQHPYVPIRTQFPAGTPLLLGQ